MSRSRNRPEPEPPPRAKSPFEALRDQLGDKVFEPAGPEPVHSRTDDRAEVPAKAPNGTIRLRRERAGRGGKTVVVLEGPGIEACDRGAFATQVARALGTGAKVEGDTIVVRGDVQARLSSWLASEGFGDVRCAN